MGVVVSQGGLPAYLKKLRSRKQWPRVVVVMSHPAAYSDHCGSVLVAKDSGTAHQGFWCGYYKTEEQFELKRVRVLLEVHNPTMVLFPSIRAKHPTTRPVLLHGTK
jgi:hypothetical protein